MPSTTTTPDLDPAELRPLLGDLDARSRGRLAAVLREVRVAADAPLLVQGQPNDRLWFVAAGSVTIERVAAEGLHLWTLDRDSDDRLRRDDPRTAEDLNRAIIRILSERFDLLDGRLARMMAQPDPGHNNPTQPVRSELAAFRTRLFEEPGI